MLRVHALEKYHATIVDDHQQRLSLTMHRLTQSPRQTLVFDHVAHHYARHDGPGVGYLAAVPTRTLDTLLQMSVPARTILPLVVAWVARLQPRKSYPVVLERIPPWALL